MHQFYIILVSKILEVYKSFLVDSFSTGSFCPFCLHLLFFMHLLIILSYKTLKLKSISNELWKGWKLAWYHHFIHIACARKLRGLRQKLDALRVKNGQWNHTRLLQSWHGIIIIVAGESLHFFFACVICLLRHNHG